MKLGVCYYPEHWPPERWATDARMMREAGLSAVRLAEFAWAKIEPAEGRYDWTWLDEAIAALAAEGLRVVLGTPTPTPPAWLVRRHPDILPVDAQGRRREFGSRRHYCANNPAYQAATRRIVTAMAERYGQHDAVIGWQTDNEFGCHDTARCYCDFCAAAFRDWLRARYGSLDALNRAWGTVFWSQTYGAWDEIRPPNLTVTEPNPSHVLDWYRFSSDAVAAYQDIQLEILRQLSPGRFVTHNFMGTFPDLDHYRMARGLDFISWDSYPTGYAERTAPALYLPDAPKPPVAYDVGDPYVTGFCHDLMRGLKAGAPFWVMEQQAGQVNWGDVNPGVRPGTVRLWTWHDLAAGADAVLYFRWRACLFAQEQYHSGLLRHDAQPDLGYREVQRLKGERALMERVAGSPVRAEVALLADYDDLWAFDLQPHNRALSYWRHLFAYHRALMRSGVPADIVSKHADLTGYRLVLAPTLLLADDALAERLAGYVRAGGTLLLGVRSGFKTPTNLVTDRPLPGPFRSLVGATVEAWHSLPGGVTYGVVGSPGQALRAGHWAERLSPSEATAVLSYYDGPWAGSAAVTLRELGQGRSVYAGLWPTDAVADAVLRWLLPLAGVEPLALVTDGVLACRRGSFIVLLNFTEAPAAVWLSSKVGEARDAFTGQPVQGQVTIPGRDLRLLAIEG